MPTARSMTADLTRLLAAVAVPVYLLDPERRLLYCNPACADWLGVPAEELAGQTVGYHSSPAAEAGSLTAGGLCPPPEAFSGCRTSAIVAALRDAGVRRRRAEFLPLADDAGGWCGVLAVVEPVDLPVEEEASRSAATDAIVSTDESLALHARLQQLHAEIRRHAAGDRLLGESAAMARVRAQVRLAAAGRPSVLVVGPRGSGRQHVARAIHYEAEADPAAPGLVPLSCLALGTELLRSTLAALLRDGPERSSARGLSPFAESSEQKGTVPLSTASAGGTLLLTDVDELPLELQSELVEALSRRGGLSLRIMATSQLPLDEAAAAGQFRLDLACLLSTIVIRLPPLTERPGDIPLLAQMFLEELNAEGGRQLRGFAPEALDQLAAYSWPGNIDELAGIVRQSHAKAEGPEISLTDLPQRIFLAAAAARQPRRAAQPIALADVLAGIERQLIQRALELAKGNKAKAARLLGLTRPRLYRRMVQMGLEAGTKK